MDEHLRNLERGDDVIKYLRAKMRAGNLSKIQLQLAACLRYPPAVALYPNSICGIGDGERPTLTSEGMVVHCAGAMQLGAGIFETLHDLNPPEIYMRCYRDSSGEFCIKLFCKRCVGIHKLHPRRQISAKVDKGILIRGQI